MSTFSRPVGVYCLCGAEIVGTSKEYPPAAIKRFWQGHLGAGHGPTSQLQCWRVRTGWQEPEPYPTERVERVLQMASILASGVWR